MKTIIKLFLLVLLSAFSVSASLAQNSPQAFSLKQAVDYALQNQERIKIAQNDVKSANAKIGEIRAIGLPQVNIGAEVGNNFIPQSTFLPAEIFGGPAGQFLPVEFTPKYTGSAAISASQLLFNGSYLIGLKAASTYSQLSAKQLIQTEIQTTEQVSKAYYTVLVSRARRELLTANLSRLDTLLKQTKQM